MKRYIKFIFILFVINIIFISISCKSNETETNSSVIETKEETFLTYSGDEFPKPIGYVNDYTDIIDQGYEDKILSEVQKVKEETDANLVVVVIESLEGKSIDDYSVELYNIWNLTRNGVLLFIAMKEKKIRITTGYDVEEIITNDVTKKIIDEVIVLRFNRGEFEESIYQGVIKISDYILNYES